MWVDGYREAPLHWKVEAITICSLLLIVFIIDLLQIWGETSRSFQSVRNGDLNSHKRVDGTIPHHVRRVVIFVVVFNWFSFLFRAYKWKSWGHLAGVCCSKVATTLTCLLLLILIYNVCLAVYSGPSKSSMRRPTWPKKVSVLAISVQFVFSWLSFSASLYLNREWPQGIYIFTLSFCFIVFNTLMWYLYHKISQTINRFSQDPHLAQRDPHVQRMKRYLTYITTVNIGLNITFAYTGYTSMRDFTKEFNFSSRGEDFSFSGTFQECAEIVTCFVSIWYTWKPLPSLSFCCFCCCLDDDEEEGRSERDLYNLKNSVPLSEQNILTATAMDHGSTSTDVV